MSTNENYSITMPKKYIYKGKLIKLFNLGDNAIFEINKIKLHCFIPDFDKEFEDSWGDYHGKNLENKEYSVELGLLDLGFEIHENGNTYIKQESRTHYKISGKIVYIDKQYGHAIIDCGVPIILFPRKDIFDKIKIGTFIEAKGRLDIFLDKEYVPRTP